MNKILTLVAAAMMCALTSQATVTLTQEDGTPVTDGAQLFFNHCDADLQAAGFLQVVGHLVMTTDADIRASVKLEALSGDPVIDFCVNDQCIPADKVVTKNVNMVVGRKYLMDFHLGGIPHLATEKLTAESRLTITAGAQTINVTIKMSNDPAGATDVTAASPVVSSEYYDLTGRQLNAAPAQGVYLRRDSRADGTTVTVKTLER